MAKEYLLSSVHVHTKLCDGKNTPEELALSAWKVGLKTLGFSVANAGRNLPWKKVCHRILSVPIRPYKV